MTLFARASLFAAVALCLSAPVAGATPESPDAGATLSTAASLASGAATGELSSPTDVDVYTAEVAYGAQVRIDVSAPAGDPAVDPACGQVTAHLIDSAADKQESVSVNAGAANGTGMTFVDPPSAEAPVVLATPTRLAVVEVTGIAAKAGCSLGPRGYGLTLTSSSALSAAPAFTGNEIHERHAGVPADAPVVVPVPGTATWTGTFDTTDDSDEIPLGTVPAGTRAVIRVISTADVTCPRPDDPGYAALSYPAAKDGDPYWNSPDVLWRTSLVEDPGDMGEEVTQSVSQVLRLAGPFQAVAFGGFIGRGLPLTLTLRATGCVNYSYAVSVSFEPIDGAPLCARSVRVSARYKAAVASRARATAAVSKAHHASRSRRKAALRSAQRALENARRHVRTLRDARGLADAECQESGVHAQAVPPTVGAS